MRLMSFAITTSQFKDGSKDVTRRDGWDFLKPGDRICGVRKAMGLKKGEKVQRLGVIEVVSVRREQLRRMLDEPEYGREECRREGFPNMTPAEFVKMFSSTHGKITPESIVTRIEFRHV